MKIMFDNEVGLSKTVIMSARIIYYAQATESTPGTGRVTLTTRVLLTQHSQTEPCPASFLIQEKYNDTRKRRSLARLLASR